MTRGSMKLPSTTLMARKPRPVATAAPAPIWTSASSTAGTAARIEPMLGM